MDATAVKYKPFGPTRSWLGYPDRATLNDLVERGEIRSVKTVTGRRLYDVGSYVAAKLAEGYVLMPLDGSKPEVLSLVQPRLTTKRATALRSPRLEAAA